MSQDVRSRNFRTSGRCRSAPFRSSRAANAGCAWKYRSKRSSIEIQSLSLPWSGAISNSGGSGFTRANYLPRDSVVSTINSAPPTEFILRAFRHLGCGVPMCPGTFEQRTSISGVSSGDAGKVRTQALRYVVPCTPIHPAITFGQYPELAITGSSKFCYAGVNWDRAMNVCSKCPRCESEVRYRSRRHTWIEWFLSLALLPYRCAMCQTRYLFWRYGFIKSKLAARNSKESDPTAGSSDTASDI